MLFTLMSNDNNISYNTKIANIFGLSSAVVISVFLTEQDNATKNGKLVSNKYFKYSRTELYEKTALMDDKQKEIEENLIDCKVLERERVKNSSDKFYYYLNEELLLKIISANDRADVEKLLTPTTDKKATKKKLVQEQRVKPPSARKDKQAELIANIKETDPIIRDAIKGWIEGVYANPNGFLSMYAINSGLKLLQNFAGNNLDLKLEIFRIAAVNGYRDMEWAINKYNANKPANSLNMNTSSVIISDEEKAKNKELLANAKVTEF